MVGAEIGPRPDPLEQGADVLVPPVTQHPIVELGECFAVAGRAANVGENDRDAELVDVVVVPAEEAGPGLALRSAVDIDDHRATSREAGGRLIEEARDGPPVETGPMHQLGLGEVREVEPGRLTLGPAGDPAAREVQRVSVGGGTRTTAPEPHPRAGLPPAEVRVQAGRELAKSELPAPSGRYQRQHGAAATIHD